MGVSTELAVRILTGLALAGLLFSAGLQLRWREVARALAQSELGRIMAVNFVAVPALTSLLIWAFKIPSEIAAGLILLGASPFAPVVPTYARMARGDLALAAVLTGVFPVLSAFVTPAICELSIRVKFDAVGALLTLFSTITLPLALGVTLNHYAEGASRRLRKPAQIFSEAVGAAGLVLVVATKYEMILGLGWKTLLAVVILSELSFLAGWFCVSSNRKARLVIAIGSANRNIALALLIATQSFPGSQTVASVAGCGLILIVLGLVHVAWGRFWLDAQ